MSTAKPGSDRRSAGARRRPLAAYLARIPTLFGRVLYLASLRNPASGAYEHSALAQMVGEEEAHETLRRSHARVFQDWLCLNLEQQKADLQEYLAEAPNPAALLAGWTDLRSTRIGRRPPRRMSSAVFSPATWRLCVSCSDASTAPLPLIERHSHSGYLANHVDFGGEGINNRKALEAGWG